MSMLKRVWLLLILSILFNGGAMVQAADTGNHRNQDGSVRPKTEEEKAEEKKEKMKQLEKQLNSIHSAEQAGKIKNLQALPRIPKAVTVVPRYSGNTLPSSGSVNVPQKR